MPSASQRRGDAWERSLASYLRSQGVPAYRLRPAGRHDVGDLSGLDSWAIEAKDDAGMSPQAMAAQADREAANAGKPFGAAVRKTRGKGPAEATVVLSMATWLRVLAYLEAVEGR